MEDFAPIFWVLVIIGVSIYGSVSKARQKLPRGQEKQAHGEAWPSWDMESAPEQPHKQPHRLGDPHDGQLSSQHESDELPGEYPVEPDMQRSTPRNEPFGRQWKTHPGEEAETTLEIPEFRHETSSEQQTDTSRLQTPKTADFTRLNQHSTTAASTYSGVSAPGLVQEAMQEQECEASQTEISEDFDLRKAVIYAEILKPKFDE